MTHEVKNSLGKLKLLIAVAKVLIALCVLAVTVMDSTIISQSMTGTATDKSVECREISIAQKNAL